MRTLVETLVETLLAGGDAVVLVETLVEKRNKNPRRRRRENHRRAKLILNMSDMFTLAVRVYCLS